MMNFLKLKKAREPKKEPKLIKKMAKPIYGYGQNPKRQCLECGHTHSTAYIGCTSNLH